MKIVKKENLPHNLHKFMECFQAPLVGDYYDCSKSQNIDGLNLFLALNGVSSTVEDLQHFDNNLPKNFYCQYLHSIEKLPYTLFNGHEYRFWVIKNGGNIKLLFDLLNTITNNNVNTYYNIYSVPEIQTFVLNGEIFTANLLEIEFKL